MTNPASVAILDAIPEVVEASGVPIEITFDDGNASDADIALPALVERGLSATFFVCAGRVGAPGYLDGAAMGELISAGMRIGSHGWSHLDWRHVDGPQLDQEIDGARRSLADVTGRAIDEVAIPFGRYDRRVIGHLKRSAFGQVFSSDGGRARSGTWLAPREAYTTAWTATTLSEVAVAQPSPVAAARRLVVRSLKQLR